MLALVSVPMAYGAWLMTAALGALVEAATGRASHPLTLGWMPARDLLGHELLYWTAVAGSTALRTLIDARENERRAARLMLEKSQLETSLRQAELDALRMRLQPHFLFNSLQNISVLTQHDPATAGRMLTRLGDLLRASLARDREAETTLDDRDRADDAPTWPSRRCASAIGCRRRSTSRPARSRRSSRRSCCSRWSRTRCATASASARGESPGSAAC